jgi:hypothetical protein
MNNKVSRAEFLDEVVDVDLRVSDVVVDPDVVCTVVPSVEPNTVVPSVEPNTVVPSVEPNTIVQYVEPNTVVPSVEPNTIVACSDKDGKSDQQMVADAKALYQKIQGLYKHGTLPEQRQKLYELFQSDMYKVHSCDALKQAADGMIANDTPAKRLLTERRIQMYNMHVNTYCEWDASRE